MKLNIKEWIAKVSSYFSLSVATCTPASGWTNYNANEDPKVYKRGGVCTFQWQTKPTGTSVTIDANWVNICTIPVGFRPSRGIFALHQGSGTAMYIVLINPDGNVYIARHREMANANATYLAAGTSTGYTWFPISITYVCAQTTEI